MTKALFSLLLMTLAFGASGCIALIVRRIMGNRGGRFMYYIWLAVIIAAVVPFNLVFAGGPIPKDAGYTLTVGEKIVVGGEYNYLINEQSVAEYDSGVLHPYDGDLPDVGVSVGNTVGIDSEGVKANNGAKVVISTDAVCAVIIAVIAIGTVIAFVRPLISYVKMKKQLLCCSTVCKDAEINQVFIESACMVGVKRSVQLRIVHGLVSSPCVFGVIHPVIFFPQKRLGDKTSLGLVFSHELFHVKKCDIIYKLLALGAMSVHWANPLSHIILPKIYEDCELACDSRVVRNADGDEKAAYMNAILDAAADSAGKIAPAAGLFMSASADKKFLRRRFISMRTNKLSALFRSAAVLAVAAAICVNTVIMSAFALGSGVNGKIGISSGKLTESQRIEGSLTALTELIVRYYYNLGNDDEITQQMLDGITSLRLTEVIGVSESERDNINTAYITAEDMELLFGKTVIGFTVNYLDADDSYNYSTQVKRVNDLECGLSAYVTQPYSVMPKNFYENMMMKTVLEKTSELNFEYKKIRAYYLLKDEASIISDRAREELIAAFPRVADNHPIYLFDPTASVTEYIKIINSLMEYSSLDTLLLDTAEVDVAQFEVFRNLEQLTLVGLSAK